MERKRICLCLAHMLHEGIEKKNIKNIFDTNWVVPLGPNVNGFGKDLEIFVNDISCVSPVASEQSSSAPLRLVEMTIKNVRDLLDCHFERNI